MPSNHSVKAAARRTMRLEGVSYVDALRRVREAGGETAYATVLIQGAPRHGHHVNAAGDAYDVWVPLRFGTYAECQRVADATFAAYDRAGTVAASTDPDAFIPMVEVMPADRLWVIDDTLLADPAWVAAMAAEAAG